MKRALLLSGLCLSCATVHQSPRAPAPEAPAVVYTASGATPIEWVDSIASPDPRKQILGQYDYLNRRLYISRAVKDPLTRIKVVEHERCHIVLAETGLQMHFVEVTWLVELLCDAWANAAVSQLERGKD